MIDEMARGNPDRLLDVPLQLDLAPAALQCLMSLGAIGPAHIAVQSIERLCVQALGVEGKIRALDPHRYDNLLDYAVTQQSLFGSACTHLMHGQGRAASLASAGGAAQQHDASNPAVFLARCNSGQHHPRTVIRAMPAAVVYGGAQLTGLLNFFDAALARADAVIYRPAEGRVVILADCAFDGMMLGAGAMVCEHLMRLTGFEKPIDVDGAQHLLDMDDAALQAWLREHPLIESAVRRTIFSHTPAPLLFATSPTQRVSCQLEFMLTTADGSISGHLGYTFVASEGSHRDVARRLADMLQYTRRVSSCDRISAPRVDVGASIRTWRRMRRVPPM